MFFVHMQMYPIFPLNPFETKLVWIKLNPKKHCINIYHLICYNTHLKRGKIKLNNV